MFHSIKMLATTSLMVVATAATSIGQETQTDNPPVETREEVQMAVIATDDGSAPMVFSTRSGSSTGGMSFISNGDFVMPAPDPFSMIGNPSVQKDLELVGDQLDKVRELQKRQFESIRERIKDLGNKGNHQELGLAIKKMQEGHRAELQELLLPNQIERLKQVALQTHMKQAGTAAALGSKMVKEKLGLTEDQIKNLKSKAKKLKKKMEEQIAKLKKQMKTELLAELTPEQRDKLKDMTGDAYTPKKNDWSDSIQRRIKRRTKGSSGS